MKKNDIKLLTGILLLAILVFAGYHLLHLQTGKTVQVTVDGKLFKTLPLDQNTTYIIETKSGKNVLEIKNGSANITDADCPDKLCVHQEKISRQGQTLVCLPHKVVVSISSDSEEETLDGVAK